jgi:hypothetical protein
MRAQTNWKLAGQWLAAALMPDHEAGRMEEEDYFPWDCDEQWPLDEELGGEDD